MQTDAAPYGREGATVEMVMAGRCRSTSEWDESPQLSYRRTWISSMWAFFWPQLEIFLICVCVSTRMTVQCFFSSSSSASMVFLPSAYFFAYLLDIDSG